MDIYGFVYIDSAGILHCFYIGRTINMKQREAAHRYLVRNPNQPDAHLLKYEECRALEAQGIEWSMVKLGEVGECEYYLDSERAMVIEMVLAGHKLTNLKHGDITKLDAEVSELENMIRQGIRTTADVRKYREQKEQATQTRQQEKAQRLADNIAFEEKVRLEREAIEAQMSQKEKDRNAARIEYDRQMDERSKESVRLRKEEEARCKVLEDKKNMELYEYRKQQEAEWRAKQEFEQWKKDVHGIK